MDAQANQDESYGEFLLLSMKIQQRFEEPKHDGSFQNSEQG